MIYTNLDNFYISKEDLQNSPSRRDGVSEDIETELRVFGTSLIQEGGCLLELPEVVMATGQVLFHRFFCKESMAKFDVEKVAWTCCWLATKLEEIPRRVRDVLAVFYRLQQRRNGEPLKPLDFYTRTYEALKAELIRVERMMLREFGFIVHVEHPHKLVLNNLHMMLNTEKNGFMHEELMQEAWSLTNDSLRTTLCVRFKSEVVACGIIFMAARRLKVPLPEDPPWWELHNVRYEDICEVCWEVQALYQRPKARYLNVLEEQPAVGRSSAATPQASPLVGQSSPASAGAAVATSSVEAAPAESSARPEERSRARDTATAQALPNGVNHAPAREAAEQQEEDSKRHRERSRRDERAAPRSSRERERERSRDRERSRHRDRDRDGRDREARGKGEREHKKDRHRDRGHKDRHAERDRLPEGGKNHADERPDRREAAADVSRRHKDPPRHGDPARQSRRDLDAHRLRIEDAGEDGSRAEGRHRHVASSSSLLERERDRGLKRRSMEGDELEDNRRPSKGQRMLPERADKEARRLDVHLQIKDTQAQRSGPGRSRSPSTSHQNSGRRADGSIDRFVMDERSPGASAGQPSRCFPANGDGTDPRSETSLPGVPGRFDDDSGMHRQPAVRSRSRSNSLEIMPPDSPLSEGLTSSAERVTGMLAG